MTTIERLSAGILDDLQEFIRATATAWMKAGLIKTNSWGVEIIVARRPGSDFNNADIYTFGYTAVDAENDEHWYLTNASSKNVICRETGMDSHEAVAVWQGLLAQLAGAYPSPGAIIDLAYGLIVGTSGFEGDEDLLFSRTIRNWLVMRLDRLGEAVLQDARVRGDQDGEAGADRFTRP